MMAINIANGNIKNRCFFWNPDENRLKISGIVVNFLLKVRTVMMNIFIQTERLNVPRREMRPRVVRMAKNMVLVLFFNREVDLRVRPRTMGIRRERKLP